MTKLTVHRWNDGPSTASVDPHLESSSSIQITPCLIQSFVQQYGRLMHLWSIGANWHSILSFSPTPGFGAVFDHINDLPALSVDQSMDRRSFYSPTLGQNSSSCFQMLEPSIDSHNLWSIDETMSC